MMVAMLVEDGRGDSILNLITFVELQYFLVILLVGIF